jgi:hypothetical protein
MPPEENRGKAGLGKTAGMVREKLQPVVARL